MGRSILSRSRLGAVACWPLWRRRRPRGRCTRVIGPGTGSRQNETLRSGRPRHGREPRYRDGPGRGLRRRERHRPRPPAVPARPREVVPHPSAQDAAVATAAYDVLVAMFAASGVARTSRRSTPPRWRRPRRRRRGQGVIASARRLPRRCSPPGRATGFGVVHVRRSGRRRASGGRRAPPVLALDPDPWVGNCSRS